MYIKYIKLLRVNHWVKNLFFFLPVFFAGNLFGQNLVDLIIGFFLFSFAASSIYVLNDLKDVEKDKMHPTKRFRPLAAGTIPVKLALLIASLLLIIALTGGFFLNKDFFLHLTTYLLLNLAYSFGVKNIPLVDVVCIALGFVIRIQAGAALGLVPLSNWLSLMVFLLAFFMALGKRRDDILVQMETGNQIRKSISGYNKEFLNVAITIVSSITLVCYLMYTLSPEVMIRLESGHLYLTTIFVALGILRYLQIIFVKNDSGSPTKILLKDRFMQVTLMLWMLSFYFLIYIKNIHF